MNSGEDIIRVGSPSLAHFFITFLDNNFRNLAFKLYNVVEKVVLFSLEFLILFLSFLEVYFKALQDNISLINVTSISLSLFCIIPSRNFLSASKKLF